MLSIWADVTIDMSAARMLGMTVDTFADTEIIVLTAVVILFKLFVPMEVLGGV